MEPSKASAYSRHDQNRIQCADAKSLFRYPGSLLLNLGAFFLPALYGTLSKLWVANIDSSQVVLTDVYTYIGIVAEVLNDAFPRSAWNVIGDKSTRSVRSRLNLAYTLMIATATQGFTLMVIFLGYPQGLASAFVPEEVRGISLTYVRLSSVQFLTSATEAALSSSTRALDNPDVPLIFSSAKFIINIVLDLLIISKFHVTEAKPTIVSQAVVRLVCDVVSVLTGLLYFSLVVVRKVQKEPDERQHLSIGLSAFMTLLKPSVYTFTESAIRNAIYLWLVNRIVQMGETYATAWGVFNTIRWGLVMVPVQALESSTLAFVGHAWGAFRASSDTTHPRASRKEILSRSITEGKWVTTDWVL
ncbi:hypothetical protein PENSUB_10354 [Penicillium subrubescens]|jgi:hypothetical protein|uniref:Uncharacterized protein n=1 Tax=Penicillium subrubescens TaxID=1316194 RepID=A0A1Q5TBN2_9EURO|nr:hypothetical protein PENSUB_10354 [Penicillium subrubescens]